MIPWDSLTSAIDELDAIRIQLVEARQLTRTSRFYDLLAQRLAGSLYGEVIAKVVELSQGWVIVHWLHDNKAVSLYSNINSLRKSLGIDNKRILSLIDVSERNTLTNQVKYTTQVRLTPREIQILDLLSRGYTNKEIAQDLSISTSTIKNSTSKVFKKLGVGDRTQAALLARDLNLLSQHEPE